MNRLLFIPLLLISLCSFASIPLESISLEKALDKGIISAAFNYKSGRHHQRLLGRMRNNTKQAINIEVAPGTMFQAARPDWQNHVITKREKITIGPKKDTAVMFTAFCFERGDGGPATMSPFKLIRSKNAAGVGLCNILDSLDETGYAAQTAIWQLYDNKTPNRICGEDVDRVMLLRNYVGRVLNMPVTQYVPNVYVKYVRTQRARPTTFHDEEEYRITDISTHDHIEVKVFSYEQDKLLANAPFKSILVQESNLTRFIYDIRLGTLQKNEKYIVRVLKNGVVHEEWLYKTT